MMMVLCNVTSDAKQKYFIPGTRLLSCEKNVIFEVDGQVRNWQKYYWHLVARTVGSNGW